MKTKTEIRGILPGYEFSNVILTEKRQNGHNKSLTLKYRIAGYFDELVPSLCYWVETWDDVGSSRCQTYTDLNEAVAHYSVMR